VPYWIEVAFAQHVVPPVQAGQGDAGSAPGGDDVTSVAAASSAFSMPEASSLPDESSEPLGASSPGFDAPPSKGVDVDASWLDVVLVEPAAGGWSSES
jgi:hypothetical protein